jgi:SAM-dependent methyltransferase
MGSRRFFLPTTQTVRLILVMIRQVPKSYPTGLPKAARSYGEDLAYVHDAGFIIFARSAGCELLRIFHRQGVREGLVVDIGCGTGVLAEILVSAGYRVLGIDISPSMLKLARQRVPAATFRTGSFLDVPLPNCDAITCTGECLNYLFDSSNTLARLNTLFTRAFKALRPGGVLVFDFLETLSTGTRTALIFRKGTDWVVLVNKTEDHSRRKLTRQITTFRRVGSLYRRSDEVHAAKLYPKGQIPAQLRRLGFIVHVQRGYGAKPLAPGHRVIFARRP